MADVVDDCFSELSLEVSVFVHHGVDGRFEHGGAVRVAGIVHILVEEVLDTVNSCFHFNPSRQLVS